MGFLDWEGLQKLWTKIKALVEPCFIDAEVEGDKLVLTKGNRNTKYITLPSGGDTSGDEATPSIPYTTFQCYSPEYTVNDLFTQMINDGFPTSTNSQGTLPAVVANGDPVIVNFVGMLSGTFLCRFNNYHSTYYGCEFTDLTNLKTYHFEGESSSLSLYDNLSSGGTGGGTGGDSSIFDLGEQEDHKVAQQSMVDHLMQMNAETGCYLFKYYVDCSGTACFAVVYKWEGSMNGTVYDSQRRFRRFNFDIEDGEFDLDGCWLAIACFDEEQSPLETENKTVINAINELNAKLESLTARIVALEGTT